MNFPWWHNLVLYERKQIKSEMATWNIVTSVSPYEKWGKLFTKTRNSFFSLLHKKSQLIQNVSKQYKYCMVQFLIIILLRNLSRIILQPFFEISWKNNFIELSLILYYMLLVFTFFALLYFKCQHLELQEIVMTDLYNNLS